MASKNYEILLKLLLVGDSKSLKTELLRKYANPEGGFSVDTIGLDYHLQDIVHKGKKIKLQLWDTAGQERFRSVTSSYYRGAQGCLLAFNMKSMLTFSGLTYWLDEIKSNAPEMFQTFLVAIHDDDADSNEVDMDIATQFAQEHCLKLFTVNINDLQQVQRVFESVVNEIMEQTWKRKASKEESIKVESSGRRGNAACFC